jgi:hypothetical protein
MSKNDTDVFKDVFKLYKRRDKPLDLSKVIDFRFPQKWSDRIQAVELETVSDIEDAAEDVSQFSDLTNHSDWKIYKLLPEQNSSAGDGIFYICNPFSDPGKSG